MIGALLGGDKKQQAQLPALLDANIVIQRSVVHKCAQADMTLINECIGIADHPQRNEIAAEYLQTDDGKALMRGLKGYILYATGRTL